MSRLRLVLVLASLLGTSTTYAADIVGCRATCVAFDFQRGYVVPLGFAKGSSEVNEEEAFDLMERDCRHKAQAAGLGRSIMLVSDLEATHDKSESSANHYDQNHTQYRGAEGPLFLRLPPRSSSDSSSQSSSSSKQNIMVYKAKPVDYNSCQPIHDNPNGRPKYQGELKVLG